jgi:hypothetical protein
MPKRRPTHADNELALMNFLTAKQRESFGKYSKIKSLKTIIWLQYSMFYLPRYMYVGCLIGVACPPPTWPPRRRNVPTWISISAEEKSYVIQEMNSCKKSKTPYLSQKSAHAEKHSIGQCER